MSQATRIDSDTSYGVGDRADTVGPAREPYDVSLATDPTIVVYRISGAFFFGSAGTIGTILDRLAERPKTLVLDFSAVPFLDSTAANTVEGVAAKAARNGVALIMTGTKPAVREALWTHGVRQPNVRYASSIEAAVKGLGKAAE
jgi:SulP family sulfate permease